MIVKHIAAIICLCTASALTILHFSGWHWGFWLAVGVLLMMDAEDKKTTTEDAN